MTTVGTRLKQYRDALNLSQERVGARAGITRNAYAKIESGRADPKLSTIVQVAEALQQDVADVVRGLKTSDTGRYLRDLIYGRPLRVA